MAETKKRVMTGQVYKSKMDKTIVVEVVRKIKDKKYHKIVSKRTRFQAHDENNECNVGDVVKIIEHQPISKNKTWMLTEVVRKAVEV